MPTAPAAASHGMRTERIRVKRSVTRTDRSTCRCCRGNGCRRSRRSTTACARRRRLVWPTSAAARGGRRSRSQGRIQACGWTASTGMTESIAIARRNADESGIADRVSFEARDAGEPGDAGAYDVVTFFECLHDMSRPVDALRVARGLLTGGGVVFVADEPTNDEFTGSRGRSRSVSLRMEPVRLPPDGDDRSRFGGHRHGDASIDAAVVCPRGGIRRLRRPTDRGRFVPVVPAPALRAPLAPLRSSAERRSLPSWNGLVNSAAPVIRRSPTGYGPSLDGVSLRGRV